jgi:hypothetical protein
MPEPVNYLLGFGERLTAQVPFSGGFAEKKSPYTFQEAKDRVVAQATQTAQAIDSLSPDECPDDLAVASFVLHPQYVSKSSFPLSFFLNAGLQPIGSKPTTVTPEKWTRTSPVEATPTTEVFVAAYRQQFRNLASSVARMTQDTPQAEALQALENFHLPDPASRIAPRTPRDNERRLFEAVFHLAPNRDRILAGLSNFLGQIQAEADFQRLLEFGQLGFIPLTVSAQSLDRLSRFSFLRVIRTMPKLRLLRPTIRGTSFSNTPTQLPDENALTASQSVAIFDGGLPPDSNLRRWITPFDAPGVGPAVAEYLQHGHDVSSAFLFGSITASQPISRPLAEAHHYRVLDANSEDDLFDVLARIQTVLEGTQYDFINLSIGPEIPVEDTDVHAWTAFVDQHIYETRSLVAVASGNGGERDETLGLCRIQTPADSVNALTIGASNSRTSTWKRALYSSKGPGRQPGVIKPDLVSFGGDAGEPFLVTARNQPSLIPVFGTSFASPSVLRLGVAVRASLGTDIVPLSVKALLIHCASKCSHTTATPADHGWGGAPDNLDSILVCPSASARVVYHGVIRAGQVIRARVPMPTSGLQGKVTISATLCYFAEVDPDHPASYTRSAVDVKFRPHITNLRSNGNPKTESFFSAVQVFEETDLRTHAFKWETTLHASRTKQSSKLNEPVFDIHHIARQGGASTGAGSPIVYSLVITISSPRTPDLYNKIVQRYNTVLRPLVPVIRLQT